MEKINLSAIIDNFLGSASDHEMLSLLESAREGSLIGPEFGLDKSCSVTIPVRIQDNLENVYFSEPSPKTFRLDFEPIDFEGYALAA